MAKVGFWLQGSTGKLAGSALQKGANGTIVRQIVKPKNPKTSNQILQRVLMNTVIQGYSALQAIACHSFQGKTEGAQCMAEFQKQNLAYFRNRAASIPESQLSAFVNFAPIGTKGVRPARFIVSEGTLPRVPVTITPTTFNAVMALSANTYQAVIDDYDLKRGDQLTFVIIEESTVNAGEYVAKYARIILDPRDADGNAAALSSPLIGENNSINLPNEKNAGNFGLLQFSNGMEFSMKAGAKVCAAGIIVSRLDGEEWKRSNCQLIVSEAAIGDNGISLARAIRISKERQSIYMTDANQYLDNAGVGGSQSTDSGSGESEEEQDENPTYTNTVDFAHTSAANAEFTSQSVAGGSVSFTAPLAQMKFHGNNLGEAPLVVKNGDTEVGTWTKQNNYALWGTSNAVEAGTTLSVYKDNVLWFSVNVAAQSGGGSGWEEG